MSVSLSEVYQWWRVRPFVNLPKHISVTEFLYKSSRLLVPTNVNTISASWNHQRHNQVLPRVSLDRSAAQHLMDIIVRPPESPIKYEYQKLGFFSRTYTTEQPCSSTQEQTTWPTLANNPQH